MKVQITTISPINLRTGPGMVFNSNNKVEAGTTLTAIDTARDGNNNLWYRTSLGWACGNYVTLDKDKHKSLNNRKNMLSRERDDADDRDNGETVDISQDPIDSGEDVNGGIIGSGTNDQSASSEPSDVFLQRRMFGVPYQFLPSTDIRDDKIMVDAELGLVYGEAMAEAPILSVVPGAPIFMPDLSNAEKKGFIDKVSDKIKSLAESGKNIVVGTIDDAINEEDIETRFFTFAEDFTTFIRYFNTLCSICSIHMGIGDDIVPGFENENPDYYKFKYFNWAEYSLANHLAGRKTYSPFETSANSSIAESAKSTYQRLKEGISNSIKSFKEGDSAIEKIKNVTSDVIDLIESFGDMSQYYTDFYIDPNISYSETFGNQTRESMMAGLFEGASQWSKELSFLLNSSMIAKNNDDNLSSAYDQIMKSAREELGEGGSFITRFLRGATTVLSGANITFPELWSNSSFNKNFNITINLKTAYGTRRSIFLDIIVPSLFWVALAAPRQASANSYAAPFLLRCYVPGMFTVDTGIIDNLTITKGGDGSAWSKDGLPLEATISVNVKELYSAISIGMLKHASLQDAAYLLQNTSLIDYIAIQSGVDLRKSEFGLKLKIADALIRNAADDLVNYELDRLKENSSSRIYNIFGAR